MPESSQKSEIRSSLLKYAANILSRRPYFRHALKEKLILRAKKNNRHCACPPLAEGRCDVAIQDYLLIIDNILDDLSASGYLDDVYLAEAFVRRQLSKCWGPKIISLKLNRLHLDQQTINTAIFSEATKELQIEAVKKFVAKNSRKDIRLVTNKLYQRGFSGDIIKSISPSPRSIPCRYFYEETP